MQPRRVAAAVHEREPQVHQLACRLHRLAQHREVHDRLDPRRAAMASLDHKAALGQIVAQHVGEPDIVIDDQNRIGHQCGMLPRMGEPWVVNRQEPKDKTPAPSPPVGEGRRSEATGG